MRTGVVVRKHSTSVRYEGCVVVKGPEEGERFVALGPDRQTAVVDVPRARNVQHPNPDYDPNNPRTWGGGVQFLNDRGELYGVQW